jgi:hypothetical protein
MDFMIPHSLQSVVSGCCWPILLKPRVCKGGLSPVLKQRSPSALPLENQGG